MDFDFTQILKDVAPDIISGGLSIVGNNSLNDDLSAAGADFSEAAFAAADRVNQGYDEQLAHREEGSDVLRTYMDAGLIDTTTILELASGKYGEDLMGVAQDFARQMAPSFDQYGRQITGAAALFGDDITVTEGESGSLLQDGSERFADAYSPYVNTGDQALGELQRIIGMNPEEMTPSQLRLLEQYTDDAAATLAASNLRGAGRAGVAAVNEGRAELYAQLYDQNQGRQDAAINAGVNAGLNSTGAVATNIQGLADSLADLRYRTGTTAATTKMNAANDVAKTGYNLDTDIATKAFNAGNTAAKADYDTGQKLSDLTGQYYGNTSNIEGNRYQTRGDTAFGKAVNDASAIGTSASNDYNIATNTANNTAQVLAGVTGNIANTVKGSIDKQRENDKQL